MRTAWIGLAIALAAPAAASAATVLGTDALLVRNDASISYSNVNGRVVVGGNLSSAGATISGGSGTSVAVGGNIQMNYTTVGNGNVVYAGSNTSNTYGNQGLTTSNGSATQGTVGATTSDFAEALAISTYLGSLSSTGTVALNSGNQLILTGSNTGTDAVNIFTLTADQINNYGNNGILISGGTSAIINVLGASVNNYVNLSTSLAASNVLFNFVDATSVSFNGTSGNAPLGASILATNASVSVNNAIQGSVFAASATTGGAANIGGAGYTGSLAGYGTSSAVPEPASWFLLIAGFGLVGTAIRRSRAVETLFI